MISECLDSLEVVIPGPGKGRILPEEPDTMDSSTLVPEMKCRR